MEVVISSLTETASIGPITGRLELSPFAGLNGGTAANKVPPSQNITANHTSKYPMLRGTIIVRIWLLSDVLNFFRATKPNFAFFSGQCNQSGSCRLELAWRRREPKIRLNFS